LFKKGIMPLEISLIAAIGPQREIGCDNRLLWHLPADLKNFKAVTLGHFMVMGRKTFASIGRALPGRTTLVLSRQGMPDTPGVIVVDSWDLALRLARESGEQELFVIGGGEIFELALPFATRLYLSTVEYQGKAEVFFPAFVHYPWVKTLERHYPAEGEAQAWTYQILEKKSDFGDEHTGA
jgi:dihydrofolate reductase